MTKGVRDFFKKSKIALTWGNTKTSWNFVNCEKENKYNVTIYFQLFTTNMQFCDN
jgi:hypothetical protein